MSFKFLFPGLLFILFFSSSLFSSSGAVSVSSSLDRTEIVIGDEVLYTITVLSPKEIEFIDIPVGENLGHFEMRSIDSLEKKAGHGMQEHSWKIRMSTFLPGAFTVPAFLLKYKDAAGKTNELRTDELILTVRGMTLSEATNLDIRSLKDPMVLKDPWFVVKLLIVLLVLAGSGYWLWNYLKRKKIILPVLLPEKIIPPHTAVLETLERIRSSDLLANKQIKRYYTEVNDALRHYLEQGFGIMTMERTSREIIEQVERAPALSGLSNDLFAHFRDSDLVKFAKLVPSKKEMISHLEDAISFVHKIMPANEEKPEPEDVE